MSTSTKIDDMLLQLRQIITQNNFPTNKQNPSVFHIQQKPSQNNLIKNPPQYPDIQSLIQQSSRIIESRQKLPSPTIRGKIMAASELLRGQKPLIKKYIKEKIQSQLFTSAQAFNSQQQLSLIEQQKQLLMAKKIEEQQRQYQKRQKLIQDVKQFESDSRVKVDLREIDNIIYQEEPQSNYLIENLKENSKNVKSMSNQIKSSNMEISEIYHQQRQQADSKKAGQKSRNLLIQSEFTQVIDEEQSHLKCGDLETVDEKVASVRNVLQKHPHIVKIIEQFLKNQLGIMNIKNALKLVGSALESRLSPTNKSPQPRMSKTVSTSNIHQWKIPKSKKPSKPPAKPTITQISGKFKFKAFAISQENKLPFQRQTIAQRRINKMIGESKNFHPKKCILTKKELVYFEEKENASDSKMIEMCIPESTKFIEPQLQRIEAEQFVKEEGSFFSKKEIQIQLITIKGKTRVIRFQKGFLDGKELVDDLKKLMASRVYNTWCKLNGTNQLPVYNFIHHSKPTNLEFGSSFIPLPQTFLKKQDRQLYIKILLDLFQDRTKVQTFSLQSSKLISPQIGQILKQGKKFQKLKKIDISNVRLTKQNFQDVCQFVNEVKISKGDIQLKMANCRLDDDCFASNIGIFTSTCSKLKTLDISHNFITSKTLQIIKSCLQNITCSIRHLNLSHCPLRDLPKLNLIIKQSRKLQQLIAIDTQLHFDDKSDEELLKFFDFVKKCGQNIRKVNLMVNGAIKKELVQGMVAMWNVKILEIQVDVNWGVIKNSNKDKELLRTDNKGIKLNNLSIHLINRSQYDY